MKAARIAAWLLTLLLLVPFLPAAAADQYVTSALGGYVYDGTLYTFAWLPDAAESDDAPMLCLTKDFAPLSEMRSAERLCTQDTPADYLLLVDNSTSMAQYLPQMLALVDALFSPERSFRVCLATLGTDFTVQQEALETAEDVGRALSELHFDEQGTDICGGVAHALAHVCGELWTPGELGQIVLMTDGEPFYSRNPETQAESQSAAAKAVEQLLDETPQVFLHLVCLNSWEQETYASLKHGCGMDLLALDPEDAMYDGGLLASWYDVLYRAEYPNETRTEGLSLRTENNEIVSLPRCGVAPSAVGTLQDLLDQLPAVVDAEPDESEPEQPEAEPAAPPAETEPSAEAATEPEESGADDSAAQSETQAASASDAAAAEPPAKDFPWLIVAIGGAALLGGLIALLLILSRKKKKQPAAAQPAPQSGPAIPVQLTILTGSQRGQTKQLALQEHLMLGRDSRCDLVLTDPGVSALHTRIFRQGQELLVEDLHSTNGTALGGMRLHNPNRLRPGDQLTLGNVVIRVQF